MFNCSLDLKTSHVCPSSSGADRGLWGSTRLGMFLRNVNQVSVASCLLPALWQEQPSCMVCGAMAHWLQNDHSCREDWEERAAVANQASCIALKPQLEVALELFSWKKKRANVILGLSHSKQVEICDVSLLFFFFF